MTMITAKGLIMEATARGITSSRSCGKVVTMLTSVLQRYQQFKRSNLSIRIKPESERETNTILRNLVMMNFNSDSLHVYDHILSKNHSDQTARIMLFSGCHFHLGKRGTHRVRYPMARP